MRATKKTNRLITSLVGLPPDEQGFTPPLFLRIKM
jgi:hypothetical protein